MKRLTGDLELVETYQLSLGDIVRSKVGGSRELNDVLTQIQSQISGMREIFSETSLNVTQSK